MVAVPSLDFHITRTPNSLVPDFLQVLDGATGCFDGHHTEPLLAQVLVELRLGPDDVDIRSSSSIIVLGLVEFAFFREERSHLRIFFT